MTAAALLAEEAASGLLRELGVTEFVPAPARFTGGEPSGLSRLHVGTASAAALGALGQATAALWRLRGGRSQVPTVDLVRAAQALYVTAHSRRHDTSAGAAPHAWQGAVSTTRDLNSFLPTRDGRFIDLVLGSTRPSQRRGVLTALGCSIEDVPLAVLDHDAETLEELVHQFGAAAGAARSVAQWAAHPHGRHLASRPVVILERIGDAPRRRLPLSPEALALDGIRVLDATHVIAGPMVGRTLAEQGADVLHVTRPDDPDPDAFLLDLGLGKRNHLVDLETAAGRAALDALFDGADVFVQSFRPGSMAARGWSEEALAVRRPGMVMVSVSAFGVTGPWAGRRGVDPVAQAVTGIALQEHGDNGEPQMSRIVTLTDPLAGYLAALGTTAALVRQATEGGTWAVRVSLAGTGMWLQGLGPSGHRPERGVPLDLSHLTAPRTVTLTGEAFGRTEHLAPVVELPATPGRWRHGPQPAATHSPTW